MEASEKILLIFVLLGIPHATWRAEIVTSWHGSSIFRRIPIREAEKWTMGASAQGYSSADDWQGIDY